MNTELSYHAIHPLWDSTKISSYGYGTKIKDLGDHRFKMI